MKHLSNIENEILSTIDSFDLIELLHKRGITPADFAAYTKEAEKMQAALQKAA